MENLFESMCYSVAVVRGEVVGREETFSDDDRLWLRKAKGLVTMIWVLLLIS